MMDPSVNAWFQTFMHFVHFSDDIHVALPEKDQKRNETGSNWFPYALHNPHPGPRN